MMTLPQIVERPATPYVALKKHVTLPFDDEIPAILARLDAYLDQHGLEPLGPVFFKHNVVDMPRLEMEFGVPVAHPVDAEGDFVSGMLPAGRHAEISYTGPYDDLIVINAVLIGWSRHTGLVFDSRHQADGEWFAHRSEILHNSPLEEPDPDRLRTTVTIKLKD
jgi:effector-binding domain-containing protein